MYGYLPTDGKSENENYALNLVNLMVTYPKY